MDGIIKLTDIHEELLKYKREGIPTGFETGWDGLSKLYRPARGYMTIATGAPQSGKSEMLDALYVNLAWLHGWKFAIYSPENYPIAFHVNKLVEKYVGLPLAEINETYFQEACQWVDEHFTFLYPPEDKCSLEDLLSMVYFVDQTYDIDGFVFDPWNEINHNIGNESETQYISNALGIFRRFCRKHKLHGWLVAHPTKLQKDKDGKYPVPTPWDISGSAHWRNKADYCLTVHREDLQQNNPKVYVQKVKFKQFGKIGVCDFYYDWKSGRFKESMHKPWTLPRR